MGLRPEVRSSSSEDSPEVREADPRFRAGVLISPGLKAGRYP